MMYVNISYFLGIVEPIQNLLSEDEEVQSQKNEQKNHEISLSKTQQADKKIYLNFYLWLSLALFNITVT